MPIPASGLCESGAVDVLQLRVGHWAKARQFLHGIGYPASHG